MLLNGRKETWVKLNPGLSAYRPSNNQERITKQGGQKNAKNTLATAIHTDQGPEKRCGTYKTGPIVRLFNQFSIECSAIFLHVAVEI